MFHLSFSHHEKKKTFLLLVVVLLALLNIALAFFYFSGYRLDQHSWYEIHLTDGTIYAGHIKKITNDTLVVTRGYILVAYESKDSSAPASAHFKVANPDRVYDVEPFSEDPDGKLELNRSTVRYWAKVAKNSSLYRALQ